MDALAKRHTFILRLWEDDAPPAPDAQLIDEGWRGEVLHVISGRRRYVRGWGEVEAFVRDILPHALPPRP